MSPRRIAFAGGAVLFLAVCVFLYWQFGTERTFSVGADRVTVAKVGYESFLEYIPISGNVVPRTTVYLDAVEGGQVTEVHVEEGASVTAGQPLVTLKNANLQLQVIAAEAQLTEQLNLLSTTRQNFEQNRLRNKRELIDLDYQIDRLSRELARQRPLVATGGATKTQIEDGEAELERNRALRGPLQEQVKSDQEFSSNQLVRMGEALDTMNRNLQVARSNLQNLIIHAPIDGQLTSLDANVGQSKAAGQRVGQVDEQGAYKVTAAVDEFYLGRVAVGQIADAEIDGRTYGLEIARLSPNVRDRQFEIDLRFNGDVPPQIRRGQTLQMKLKIGQPSRTLVLANGAFYDSTGGRWVFVVDDSGEQATRRDVRLGRRNPDQVEVLEGLFEGERVITSSYQNLEKFDRVKFNSAD